MSPSAVEVAEPTADETKVKALPVHEKAEAAAALYEAPEPESLEVKPIEVESLNANPPETSNGINGRTAANEDALPKRHEDHKEPLKPSGVLDQFTSFDITPVIGREFVGVDLVKWLRAPNSDELLRDLAITSSSIITSSVAWSPC